MARKQLGAAAAGGTDLTTRNDVLAMAPGLVDGGVQLSLSGSGSSAKVVLLPKGGGALVVNGVVCTTPAGGLSLPNTNLAASTTYLLYATAASGALNALAPSTTGHVTGADGREYLSNGASTPAATLTSRLVGMLRTDGSGNIILVRSYFKDPGFTASGSIGGSTASTSATALGGAVPFLAWADEIVATDIVGTAVNNAANTNYTVTMIDNAAVGGTQSVSQYAASVYTPVGVTSKSRVAEGYHLLQVGVSVSNASNGASWATTATVSTCPVAR